MNHPDNGREADASGGFDWDRYEAELADVAALPAVHASTAALYRSIDSEDPPTIMLDEADAQFGSKRAAEANEDLRALLNAGHSRGWPILRCVGPNQDVKAFASFAMAALAGI